MLDRRRALQIVAVLLASDRRLVAQPKPAPLTRHLLLNPGHEEVLELDFGAGAGTVKTIRLVQGAVSVTILTSDLLAALGAKTGDD